MGRIRVCHFSSVHHVWDTRVFYRECVSLSKHFDVTLIAIGPDNTFRNGVKIIGVKKFKNPFLRILFTTFKVFMLAVKEDAALYHIHDAEMIPFGIVLSILGKKVIYDIHENTADDILLKFWIPLTLRKLLAGFYTLILRFGSNFMHYIPVVANSRFLNRFYVREGQYTVIENYASLNELEPYRVSDRYRIGSNRIFYLGMIQDMYYDIVPVLEALNILKQKGRIIELDLIGYFGMGSFSDFEKLSFWNDIKDQVHYHGFKEIHEAYRISMTCQVGLCIKNQPEQMLVSHERKWFEYLSIGLPSLFCESAIYTDTQNICGQTGFSVNLKNSNEIADALEAILSNSDLQKQLGENSIQLASLHFNWEKEEVLLFTLYKKLLSPNTSV